MSGSVKENGKAASSYARSLIEASLDPLVTISADGKITDVNNSTEEATGCNRQELIGSDFSDYFTEPEKAREGYKKVFKEGYVRDYPLAIRHKSGKITDVLYNATVYRNESGEIQGVFAAARDITERKIADEKLRAASLYARSLIETSLDPLVTISAQGKINDVNKATEEVTGFSRQELIGSDFSDYFTEPQKARTGLRKAFSEGLVKDYPLAIQHKSGKITYVLYNATLYRNEKGEIQGVFAAARDITEQKNTERLAAIGATAGMVGHDIRNPLQTITGELYLARETLKNMPDDEGKTSMLESLEIIEEQIGYVNKIVSDLQDYARPLQPKLEEVNLQEIVDTVLSSISVCDKNKIHVNSSINGNCKKITSDKTYLQRILQNLVNNSVQAMPKGGKLTISANCQNGKTQIGIEDTGDGIPKEIRTKLFTPLVTMKSKGQGFGLAVVKRLTEALGGTITYETEAGKGTKFTITLPA